MTFSHFTLIQLTHGEEKGRIHKPTKFKENKSWITSVRYFEHNKLKYFKLRIATFKGKQAGTDYGKKNQNLWAIKSAGAKEKTCFRELFNYLTSINPY